MSMASRRHKGFTLIEVMIVMAVIAIISAIALPAYQSHIAKTRRGAAEGCMTELGQFIERNFTQSLRYDLDAAGNAVALPGTQCRNDLAMAYAFTWVPAQTTYVLTATPTTSQASADSACGCALTLNQLGVKGVTSCSRAVSDCWK